MKYRIYYSSHSKSGSRDCTRVIEKETDDEAIAEFERLEQKAYDNRGKYYVSELYHGLERIDQEERTTQLMPANSLTPVKFSRDWVSI